VFTVPDVEGVCPLAGVVLIYKNVERTPVSVCCTISPLS